MSSAAQAGNVALEEASICHIRAGMKDGKLTARRLVEMHLERIDAYDKQGPTLNAVILVNPGR